MENKGTRTDWRKFRKSTHLASTDLDIMVSEGKSLIFTIKEVKYKTNENVSGSKIDGFFCSFYEDIKDLKINNSNLLTLSTFVKNKGVDANDMYVVENYKDLKIELFVDTNVKFMREVVDGIRIRQIQPKETKKEKDIFEEVNFEKAKKANATLETIKKHYSVSEDVANKYLLYIKPVVNEQ